MSSAPIAITTRASAPSSAASSLSSSASRLYVPIHKRTPSSSSASSSRSRSSSPASSQRADTISAHPLIYSRASLLALGQSPLARLPLDTRDALRTSFPELVTNRRQRKAMEYHNHTLAQSRGHALTQDHVRALEQSQIRTHAHAQTQTDAQPVVKPFVRVQPRRNRPAGRAPERRRNASKVVDDVSWRGRRVVAVPIAV